MGDVQRAGLASDGGGDGLVGVVLVLWQEDVQRRRGDDLGRVLRVLGEKERMSFG